MDEKLLNRIISVAYDDATQWEKFKINQLAKKYPEIELTLNKHRKIAQQAHRISLEECPDNILENIKGTTSTIKREEKSLLFDLYSFLFRKPAISAAIFSLFLIALVSTFIIKRPEIHSQYSKQEIELADKQVKQSLALISGIFRKTSETVEKDILTDRVSKPIKESFNLVNDYLQGDKNENYN